MSSIIFYRVFLVVLLLVGLVTQIFIFDYLSKNPKIVIQERIENIEWYQSLHSSAEIEMKKISEIKTSEKDLNELYVSWWIADWGILSGLNDLKKRPNKINSISIFLFVPNKDGSLKDLVNKNVDSLIDYAKNQKIEIIGTIPLFEAETLSIILNDEQNFNRHVQQIIDRVKKYNLDGIDLDYESIYLADKKLFYEFLKKLNQEMKNINKKLVFTALAKWGDNIEYPSLPQTRRVQDYKMISDLVDELRIMTYDFISKNSEVAGPIAPLPWIEKVIQYSIYKGVPREKLVIGVHNYSFVWTERPILQKLDLINWFGNIVNNNQNEGSLVYNYEDIEITKKLYNSESYYHKEWGEEVIKVNIKNIPRIIFTINDDGIKDRKLLASKYGIKGISYWRIGNNGNLNL